ncbi:galactose mutarotase [Enterococcus sp. BWB1-3]|uniref:aldose epimerase family protein n=1 Tax=unclassified Enterococcus TaxID=2608891 RepID=UPI001921FCB7|nr:MULTISPECIES: aldose epimerase family protein [unclassified Enterococcus]MBL1229181.1 galactose mutarotase [Enterococcus sp. BWB1-3]MCB5952561.1 galactose mutarotase [Enterococcus sp. BWT-B8]
MKLTQKPFGNGATLYSLENGKGVIMEITDLGARIVRLLVPIGEEKRNIVLGFDSAEEYEEKDLYFGATIGRVAGRILNGTFTMDGKTVQIERAEDQLHTLHGGILGFEAKTWLAETKEEESKASVTFSLVSPAGENGFPGELAVSVTYSLNEENEWEVVYHAKTTQPTLFNPTNHVYFNLLGDPAAVIDDHELMVRAEEYAPVNEDITVKGERVSVEGTAFDFRKGKKLAEAFNSEDQQIIQTKGMDHPFFLKKESSKEPNATLISPDNRIEVEVFTDRSAVVIFTANFSGEGPIMQGEKMVDHGGITFETQEAPGAEHFSEFGDITLRPEKAYYSSTIYKIKTTE